MNEIFCNTYGKRDADGIYRVEMRGTGARIRQMTALRYLEWVCPVAGGLFYAVGQEEGGGSYIRSFYHEQHSDTFVPVDKKLFSWKGVSHMSLMENEGRLLAAVYGEGMLVSVRVREGQIGGEDSRVAFEGHGPREDRQEASHPHFVKWMQGEYWAADLGADAVYHCNRTEWFGKRGKWMTEYMTEGSGPRYLEMNPSGGMIYLITELSNELLVLERTVSGKLKERQRIALVSERMEESLASVLCADWTGNRLYAGIRGANLVRELSVTENGTLREKGELHTGGWPRSLLYLPEPARLLVAEEESEHSSGMLECFDLSDQNSMWRIRLTGAYQIYEKKDRIRQAL